MKYIPQYLSRIIILLILFLPCGVFGEVPQIINYQGQLLTTGGQVVDGIKSITFCLYEAPTGGSNIWCETHPSVTVTDGSFNVALGSVTSLSHLKFDVPYYLGITVEGDTEMTPRLALGSVPASLQAESVTGRTQTVDCGNGEKIMDALNAGVTTVTVKGTCTEDVNISRDDVTLNADAGGGGITGATASTTGSAAIHVISARRISITGLVIEGYADSGTGILIDGGSTVTISGVTVQNSTSVGISAAENSTITIKDSSITNNGLGLAISGGATIGDANGSAGDVLISSNNIGLAISKGGAYINNTTIEDSNLFSILAGYTSTVYLNSGVSIIKTSGIPLPSIQVTSASLAQIIPNVQTTITTNGSPAISTLGHANIALLNININSGSGVAISLNQFTYATFSAGAPDQSVDITGSGGAAISLNNSASATFNSGVTVTGGVTCNGTRTEYIDNTGGTIDSETGCTAP